MNISPINQIKDEINLETNEITKILTLYNTIYLEYSINNNYTIDEIDEMEEYINQLKNNT